MGNPGRGVDGYAPLWRGTEDAGRQERGGGVSDTAGPTRDAKRHLKNGTQGRRSERGTDLEHGTGSVPSDASREVEMH